MRKHLSVLMLFARSSICRVILLLAVMAVTESCVFYLRISGNNVSLENAFEISYIKWIFAAVFIGITIILCQAGASFGSKTEYTINRLSITEKSVFNWQWFYNSSVYFILLAAQIAVSVALCEMYEVITASSEITAQTTFLAYYRSEFLHGLLPLEDTMIWVRNAFLVIGLGAASAFFPYRSRRGKQCIEIIIMTAFTMIFFAEGLGTQTSSIVVSFISTMVIIAIFMKMRIKWNENDG